MIFKRGDILGHGGSANVFEATLVGPADDSIPHVVAIKQTRVSLEVKRTLLKHEARVLRLLQGHPSIPALYGYGRVEHFEFFATERLGSTLQDLHPSPRSLPLKTILMVTIQMLSSLEYIHSKGYIHRDVKPQNMLVSLSEPDKLRLIDFGMTRLSPASATAPLQHNPEVQGRYVMGTLDWISLNGHYGIDLSFRDDLESLAYTLLFLMNGTLPWTTTGKRDMELEDVMKAIRVCKQDYTGKTLAREAFSEFGQLLDYARGLGFHDIPDYAWLRQLFKSLHERYLGSADTDESFDWTAIDPPSSQVPSKLQVESTESRSLFMAKDGKPALHHIVDERETLLELEAAESLDELGELGEDISDSYYGLDIADWNVQGERDRSLTLPVEETERLDRELSLIEIV